MARTLIHSASAFGQDVAFGCFGTCTTAAATQVKAVTCAGFTSDMLIDGMMISIFFTYGNTSASVKLNINGTGDKWFASNNPTGMLPMWGNDTVITVVYYSGAWRMVNYVTHIQRGKVSCTPGTSATVTFPQAFLGPPYIVATLNSGGSTAPTGDFGALKIHTVTPTSFKALIYGSGVAFDVCWVAFE